MNALMFLHIVGGSVALISGAAALAVRKGSGWHAYVGTAFFLGMLVLTTTGAVIAGLKPARGTALIGILTLYLVVTSWAAARQRDGRPGGLERAALGMVLICIAGLVTLGLLGMREPTGVIDHLPWQVHFVFASVAVMAAASDIRFIRRGRLSGAQRLARHLWRMCTALLIATTSFFQGQQDEFPEAWQGSAWWHAPSLAVLGAMIFWLLRVRLSKAYARFAAGGPARPRVSEDPAEASA
ncbi:DUF2306 domain-containing protein [Sphingosinicella sp. CPCC 101087]|uniref:DUF2306 domain-containing protein n=1 Tax=Sphingosinicella sp. CPCC 101087 TaxID=2497754 RepID=UPI00101D74A4|nr:DUF2306 domain-containing protein [Sphingosinicella sp. CPCC 101087]